MDGLHAVMIWAHTLGIALYVGPQFFLAFAWVPASRKIADLPTRAQATGVITRRFGHIGAAGLLLILVSGTFLISTWRDYHGISDATGFTDVRFGEIFIGKMVLFIIMLAVVGMHMMSTGPKLVEALESAASRGVETDERVAALRKQSMLLSISGLVLALVIMVMGALLNTTQISLAS